MTSDAAQRVVVIGGGLAGMAAAVALETAGVNVTLVEARKTLGGRAGSFQDPQSGETLDNCQHVLLGCCTNLLDFYKRIGAIHRINFERTIRFVDPRGKAFGLYGLPFLPAPLHLGWSMLFFSALSLRERILMARAMLAMLRLGRTRRAAMDDLPFGKWLADHNQPESLIAKLYDAILIGSLNEQTRLSSSSYAIQVFQDALLTNATGYPLGLANCPLSELYGSLPCRDVRLGARVSELAFSNAAVYGVRLTSGQLLDASDVVVATNHHGIRDWIPGNLSAEDSRFAHLDELQSVPILGAHLWFDQPVMTHSHAAFLEGPLQWLFRKDAEGKAVHGVISAARNWLDVPKEDALKQFEAQIRATFPAAASAKLNRGVIVIEKRATFACLPGADRCRPAQAPPDGGIANLYLAGDYTQTGWPATMEGAVRSGYLAAEAILRKQGQLRSRFLQPDLPGQWPARLLAKK
jgi:squalene-associated FAD-dependent desaturase